MTHPKMTKPAAAGATTGLLKIDRLATTTINPNNNPSASTSQASSFATDDRREDDLAYFAARPDVTMRIRGPLPGESKFLRSVPQGRNPIVVVTVYRDPVTGWPVDRDRDVFLTPGGTA
jgi:hypothetical protein